MNLRKGDYFIEDAERQYEWYAQNAGWEIADRYLAGVAATCSLAERQPLLGPLTAVRHPQLAGWRFFAVVRPFHPHVIFYESDGHDLLLRRICTGAANFPGGCLSLQEQNSSSSPPLLGQRRQHHRRRHIRLHVHLIVGLDFREQHPPPALRGARHAQVAR